MRIIYGKSEREKSEAFTKVADPVNEDELRFLRMVLLLFQVPLKFIITRRKREIPIEYMLKVFELSNCVAQVCDGAFRLGVAHRARESHSICGCARHDLAWFYGHTWDYQH